MAMAKTLLALAAVAAFVLGGGGDAPSISAGDAPSLIHARSFRKRGPPGNDNDEYKTDDEYETARREETVDREETTPGEREETTGDEYKTTPGETTLKADDEYKSTPWETTLKAGDEYKTTPGETTLKADDKYKSTLLIYAALGDETEEMARSEALGAKEHHFLTRLGELLHEALRNGDAKERHILTRMSEHLDETFRLGWNLNFLRPFSTSQTGLMWSFGGGDLVEGILELLNFGQEQGMLTLVREAESTGARGKNEVKRLQGVIEAGRKYHAAQNEFEQMRKQRSS